MLTVSNVTFTPQLNEEISDDYYKSIIKEVNSLNYYLNLLSKLCEKFGDALGNFLVDFTKNHFGFENCAALEFLINRSSCWRYQEIGCNWKSKRYLSDINYIFGIAGVPLLTHKDNKINPTRYVQSLCDQIPMCTKIVQRVVIDYDLNEVIKQKNAELEEVQPRNKSQRKKIRFELNAIKRHSNLKSSGVNWESNNAKTVKIIEKYKKLVSNEESIKSLPMNRVKNYVSTYKEALLSKVKVDKSSASDIYVQKVLLNQKRSGLMEVKRLKSSLSDKIKEVKRLSESKAGSLLQLETLNVKLKSTKGLAKREKMADLELKLKNYYDCLENYVDNVETEIESSSKFKESELINVVRSIYDSNLGFGKNLHNVIWFIKGRGNDILHKRFSDNIFFKRVETVGVSADAIESQINKEINSFIMQQVAKITKVKDVVDRKVQYFSKRHMKYKLKQEAEKLKKKNKKVSNKAKSGVLPMKRKKSQMIFIKSKKLKPNGRYHPISAKKLKTLLAKNRSIRYQRITANRKAKIDREKFLIEEEARQEIERVKMEEEKKKLKLKKAKMAKLQLAEKKSRSEKLKVLMTEAGLLDKLLPEERDENSLFWVIRKIEKYLLLHPYMEYTEEERELEYNYVPKLIEIEHIKFPLFYKNTFYWSAKKRKNGLSCLKKHKSSCSDDKMYFVDLSDYVPPLKVRQREQNGEEIWPAH